MPHEISWNLAPADEKTFTGTAHSRLIGASEHDVSIKLYYVRFEAEARTNWHVHSGPQIIVVCSGRCRYQLDGEPIRELESGESIRFEPGVRHWHGAVPGEATEHIAVNLDNARTSWLDRVTDAEYRGR
ncbi:MAG: cupin domain-containing protein [Gemmatimonadota bacterium]